MTISDAYLLEEVDEEGNGARLSYLGLIIIILGGQVLQGTSRGLLAAFIVPR